MPRPSRCEADAVGVAGLEGLRGHGDRAALGRAVDRELGHLRVVDRDRQAVAVLGPLGLAVVEPERGEGRALGLVRAASRCPERWASSQSIGLVELGGLRPDPGEGQAGERGRLGGAAVPRRLARAVPVAAGRAARARRPRSSPGGRGCRAPRRPARAGRGWRTSGPGRPAPVFERPWRSPVQAVGLLEARRLAGREGVQERGPSLVVAGVGAGRHGLAEPGDGLVEHLGVGQQAGGSAVGQGPDDRGRGEPVARQAGRLVLPGQRPRSAVDPGPAAVLVLGGDQLGDQPLDPRGEPLGVGRARRSEWPGDRSGPRSPPAGRRRGRPSCSTAGGMIRERLASQERGVAAQGQLDEHPLERGRDDDQHLGALVRPPRGQADEDRRAVAAGARGRGERLHAPGADGDLERSARRSASPTLAASVSRTVSPVGHLERLEEHLLDAVALELDRLGETPRRGRRRRSTSFRAALPCDARVVDLGDEPGLVALGERGGDLEVDEEVLADGQRRRRSGRRACRRRSRRGP